MLIPHSGGAPREAEVESTIGAFSAGGEYEPVCFAVWALRNLEGMRVSVTAPEDASGEAIPSARMDLRAERSDRVLLKQESLGGLVAGASRRYYLTIYTAPGTKAGRYTGKVTVEAEGGVKVEREYVFVVLPFALDAAPLANSVYGGNYGSNDEERDMIQAKDLLAHGMDNVTCAHVFFSERVDVMVHHLIWDLPKRSEERWLGEGQERFPLKLDEKAFSNMKESGQRAPFVIDINYVLRYLPCTEENLELFEEAIRQIEAMREKHEQHTFATHWP